MSTGASPSSVDITVAAYLGFYAHICEQLPSPIMRQLLDEHPSLITHYQRILKNTLKEYRAPGTKGEEATAVRELGKKSGRNWSLLKSVAVYTAFVAGTIGLSIAVRRQGRSKQH